MEWKDIQGFEGLYQVSNEGIVVSLPRDYRYGTILNPISLKPNIARGYCRVTLHKNGKKYKKQVHRLVAQAFIPNENNYPCVNHKDECKTNNCVSNLEWCTHKYNSDYGSRNSLISKRVSKKVKQYSLQNEFIKEWNSLTSAAEGTNISLSQISACIHGRQKTAGGYIWVQ